MSEFLFIFMINYMLEYEITPYSKTFSISKRASPVLSSIGIKSINKITLIYYTNRSSTGIAMLKICFTTHSSSHSNRVVMHFHSPLTAYYVILLGIISSCQTISIKLHALLYISGTMNFMCTFLSCVDTLSIA